MASSSKSKKERRKWTIFEDENLVEALLDVHNNGKYTSENELKPSYLQAVEELLKVSLLNSGIKARPHIESRRKSLKKDWATIHDMLNGINHSSSGFGFDFERKMVTVKDDVWEAYVKSHSEAAAWKNKTFPYYEDCCTIFGKDRATGKDTFSTVDMQEEIEIEENQNYHNESHGIPSENFDDCPQPIDLTHDERHQQNVQQEILGDKLEKSAQEFNKALNLESEKRGKIINALHNMPRLTAVNKISLAAKIGSSLEMTDVFMSLNDYMKEEWVVMMLNGEL
ncbi:hypothetical protein DITRI_Ditri12bG0022500 [Diplodiscus trichospermus]